MGTIKKLMTLMSKHGIVENRSEYISAWTNGRTTSARNLSHDELQSICEKLDVTAPTTDNAHEVLALRKKRSIVLKIATDIGLKSPTDFVNFNRWMLNRSIHKKELHKYDLDDIDDLIAQLRKAERNFNNSSKIKGTKAYYAKRGFQQPQSN
jgi:hypothetical protein